MKKNFRLKPTKSILLFTKVYTHIYVFFTIIKKKANISVTILYNSREKWIYNNINLNICFLLFLQKINRFIVFLPSFFSWIQFPDPNLARAEREKVIKQLSSRSFQIKKDAPVKKRGISEKFTRIFSERFPAWRNSRNTINLSKKREPAPPHDLCGGQKNN